MVVQGHPPPRSQGAFSPLALLEIVADVTASQTETNHQTVGQDAKLHGTSGPLQVSYGG